jgi:hypothetical protein
MNAISLYFPSEKFSNLEKFGNLVMQSFPSSMPNRKAPQIALSGLPGFMLFGDEAR